MTPERQVFLDRVDVSRETIARLDAYADLLRKWNPKINLVSKSTLNELWTRHFLDSATAFLAVGGVGPRWLDLGSGAGFPGLVLAILADELRPDVRVVCVEADARKGEFLRAVIRRTGLSARVETARILELTPQSADALFARALAPLDQLLGFADRHLSPGGSAILHKGRDWENEVAQARKLWQFEMEAVPSATDDASVLLKIGDIQRG